jgi:hypothetical protein
MLHLLPFPLIAQSFRALYDPLPQRGKFPWPVSSEDWRRSSLPTSSATPA